MKRNHFIRCFQFLALAVLLWLPVRSTAQPCLLSIPLPNTASDYIAANPPWFHRDYLAAHNASTLTNHVFSDTAGVAPGPYLAWCVDLPDDINGAGATYNATFFSSCDPNLDSELPLNYPSSVYVSPDTWRQINYILNHKKGAYFFDVQVAIWNLIGGPIPQEIYGGNAAGYPNLVTNGVNDVNELLSDALANADSWEPSCGDVISVIVAVNVTPHDQLTIIEIPYPCIPSVAVTKVVACLEANGDCGNFSHQAAGYTASSCGTGPALPAFCYDITVTNTGSIPLTNLTVVDNLLQPHDLTPFFFPSPTTVLAPGEALTGKFTMAFAANATNTVTVQGQAHIGHSVTNVGGIVVTNGMPVSAGDKAVALVDNASISCDVTLTSPLDLDSSPSDNHVLLPSTTSSSTVTFNVTIKNTGSSDLVGITLAGLSTLNCAMPAPFELAAGQSTNIQLCVQIVNCPGSTFNISVTAQVGSDATHCAVLTSSGAPIYVCSSCLGMVEYTAGVSGEVLLHCNGSSADFSTDLGLGNVSVTLLDSSSNFVATTVTDNSGSYSFNNLAAGNYIVKVNLGAPYVETYPAGNTSGQISVALVPCNATGVDFGYADTTPPSVHVNPGSDYGCNPTVIISDADERTNVTASVSCGTTNVSVTHLDATNLCSASRVFTIIVSDTYGNSVTNTATYTWTVNGQPPSITVPPGYDLACNPAVIPDDSAISNTVNVTGNCSSAATFTVTHVDGAVDCAASRVFTINAVDSCGNKASTTVTYTWTVNKVPPTITVPPGSDLACNPASIPDDNAVSNTVAVTGNCGSATTFTVSHTDNVLNCAASRVFTITATDACGNINTAMVTYTWTANRVPPSITVPPGSDLACNPASIPDDSAISNTVAVTGNCGSLTTFTVTHVDGAVDCAASRVFTIMATDACGNVNSTTVTYTWTANKVPPSITVPPGSDLACNPT
ncbi:MAG TPA: SdrD B-like domain-containing protein, partial [Verrucomicrobiae bacterium]|nr:SdrD B-like domain-containing protein [Verrucomicrobiae bacterium]